jgi:predicted ATPase
VLEGEPAAGVGPEAMMQALGAWLARHPLLLVLDNCEHLLSDAAALIHALLGACPDLRILATSRQRLGITGEVVRRVPSLPAPDPDTLPAEERRAVEAVLAYPAAQLLVERAAAVRAEFEVENRAEAVAVAQICRRLDGIPLALELAAARVGLLALPQIAARLDDRFHLLTGGSRVALPRHQTLRALIDWSYELLPEAERTLLGRLAIFAGGWTLEAAEAICGEEGVQAFGRSGVQGTDQDRQGMDKSEPVFAAPERLNAQDHRFAAVPPERPDEVLDLLCALEEKSLVLVEKSAVGLRYRMLETVWEYAREKLEGSGELIAMRFRHRDWFLQWVERAEGELSGPQVYEWLARLDREQDNLRAALRWSLDHQEDNPAQRLAAALAPFWEIRLRLSEGRQALAAALALSAGEPRFDAQRQGVPTKWVLGPGPGAAPGPPRARALFAAGLLARRQDDYPAARAAWAAALDLYRQLGDRRGIASVLECQGELGLRFRLAEVPLLQESLAIRRELGDRDGMARSLYLMAEAAESAGSLAEARTLYQEGLTLDRERGDPRAIARVLVELGRLAVDRGDHATAREYLEEGLALQRELGDRYWISDAQLHLGMLAWNLGEYKAAAQYWEETLAVDLEKMGYGGLVVVYLARVMAAQGNVAGARAELEARVAMLPTRGLRPADELMTLGDLAFVEGDERAARARYEESLAFCRTIPSQWGQMACFMALWRLARRRGDAAEARSLYEQSLALHETLSHRLLIASSCGNLGEMAVGAGDLDAAGRCLTESLQQYQAIGYLRAISPCLYAWAALAAARGQWERAARLCGAAAAQQRVVEPSRPPIERAVQEDVSAAVRRSYQGPPPAADPTCGAPRPSGATAAGEAAFAAAWGEGQAMSLEEAVAYALGEG